MHIFIITIFLVLAVVVSFFLLLSSLHNLVHPFTLVKICHELVAQIAFNYSDDSTKQAVHKYSGKISMEETANWMYDNRTLLGYTYSLSSSDQVHCFMDLIRRNPEQEPKKSTRSHSLLNIQYIYYIRGKEIDQWRGKPI